MNALKKVVQIPYTFMLLNGAVITGLYCYTRGHLGFWDLVPGSKIHAPELRQL
jgi:hypothetical protein